MGTRVTLAAYPDSQHDHAAIDRALEAALAEIRRLESLMSPHRPESDVSRLNAAAGREAVAVASDSFEVITKSLWIAEKSAGVFDITFASMGPLWRFSPNVEARVPGPDEVARARARVDFHRVELDPAAHSVKLLGAETRIDLGGIAKGYAVDRAAHVLRRAGLGAFLVQAGGDLYVSGRKPGGESWRVGVRDPRGPDDSFFARLPVEDHAFSTAGDYERFFFSGGKRYHHIIDPRTGYPASASRSVSILASDALTADMVDDAVFILGPERGLELVESIEGCGAVIVDAENRVWISKRLEGVVQMLREPTDGP
jgi:thiamine biosynthesis lipoprotein